MSKKENEKCEYLQVRLTPEEKRLLKLRAKELNLTVSSVIRVYLLNQIRL